MIESGMGADDASKPRHNAHRRRQPRNRVPWSDESPPAPATRYK